MFDLLKKKVDQDRKEKGIPGYKYERLMMDQRSAEGVSQHLNHQIIKSSPLKTEYKQTPRQCKTETKWLKSALWDEQN